MNTKERVIEKIEIIKQDAKNTLKKTGREKDPLVLVAVTKNSSINQIRSLLSHGHIDFGENKVQHLQQISGQVEEIIRRKDFDFTSRDYPHEVRWHFIGHLQRNKAKEAVKMSRLIHSMDSIRIAECINDVSNKQKKITEVLIQINIAGEEQKYGLIPAALDAFLEQACFMNNIKIRGLMCLAPKSTDPENSRKYFIRMREIYEDVKKDLPSSSDFNLLSMGMSNDYKIALECGANVIRIGSAIFND